MTKEEETSPLLFPSSFIFEGASFEDCIRQSLVDINLDLPPENSDIEYVFKNGLEELKTKQLINKSCSNNENYRRTPLIELVIKLLIAIFNRKEFHVKCEEIIQNEFFTSSTELSSINPDIVTFLISTGHVDKFAQDIDKNLIDKIISNSSKNENSFSYHGCTIDRNQAIFFIINTLKFMSEDKSTPNGKDLTLHKIRDIIFSLYYSVFEQNSYEKEVGQFSSFFTDEKDFDVFNEDPETKESVNRKVTIQRIFFRKNNDLAFKMLENMNIQLFIDIGDIFVKHFAKFNPEKENPQSLRDDIIRYLVKCKEAFIFEKEQKEQNQEQNTDQQKDIVLSKVILDGRNFAFLLEFLNPNDLTTNNLWDMIDFYKVLRFQRLFIQKCVENQPSHKYLFKCHPRPIVIIPIDEIFDYLKEYSEKLLIKPNKNEITNETTNNNNENNDANDDNENNDDQKYIDDSYYEINDKDFLNTNYETIFRQNNLINEHFKDSDFWFTFLTKLSPSEDNVERAKRSFSYYFTKRNHPTPNEWIKPVVDMFYGWLLKDLHNHYEKKQSDALYSFILKLFQLNDFKQVYTAFVKDDRFHELLEIKCNYPLSFWSIFIDVSPLVDYVSNPIVMNGFSYVLLNNRGIKIPNDLQLIVFDQTEESQIVIKDFIQNHCSSIKEIFGFTTDSYEASSLITAAIFFTVTSYKTNLDATYIIENENWTIFFLIVFKLLEILYDFSPENYVFKNSLFENGYEKLFILPSDPKEISPFFLFIIKSYINIILRHTKEFFQNESSAQIIIGPISNLWGNDYLSCIIEKEKEFEKISQEKTQNDNNNENENDNNNNKNNTNKKEDTPFVVLFLKLILQLSSITKSAAVIKIISEGMPKLMPLFYSNLIALSKDEKITSLSSLPRLMGNLIKEYKSKDFDIHAFLAQKFENEFDINYITFVTRVPDLLDFFIYNNDVGSKIEEILNKSVAEDNDTNIISVFAYIGKCKQILKDKIKRQNAIKQRIESKKANQKQNPQPEGSNSQNPPPAPAEPIPQNQSAEPPSTSSETNPQNPPPPAEPIPQNQSTEPPSTSSDANPQNPPPAEPNTQEKPPEANTQTQPAEQNAQPKQTEKEEVYDEEEVKKCNSTLELLRKSFSNINFFRENMSKKMIMILLTKSLFAKSDEARDYLLNEYNILEKLQPFSFVLPDNLAFSKSELELVLKVLFNEDMIIDYHRILFEENVGETGQPALTTNTFLQTFQYEFQQHNKEFCIATIETFVKPPNVQTLIQRVERIPYRPIPNYATKFIRNIIYKNSDKDQFEIDMNSMMILYRSSYILPTLFDTFDQQDLLKLILVNSRHLLDLKFEEDVDKNNIQKKSIMSILFLFNIFSLAKHLNYFVLHFLEALSSYSQGGKGESFCDCSSTDMCVVLLTLISLLSSQTIQFITFALMIKYNWNGIASFLLQKIQSEQMNQNDESILYRLQVNQNIIIALTTSFILLLNKTNNESAPLLDEIINTENPYLTCYTGSTCINNLTLVPIKNFFSIFNSKESTNADIEHQNQNRARNRSRNLYNNGFSDNIDDVLSLNHKNDPNASSRESKFISDSQKFYSLMNSIPQPVVPHSLPLPSSINPLAFSQLTEYDQGRVIFSTLPKPPKKEEITPAIRRFLFHQPFWAAQFIEFPSEMLLLTDYYLYLHQLINEVNQMKPKQIPKTTNDENKEEIPEDFIDVTAEDLTLEEFCQPDLIKYVFSIVYPQINKDLNKITLSQYTINNAQALFQMLSNNYTTMQVIASILSEEMLNNLMNPEISLRIIKLLSKSPEFGNVFADQLSPSLIYLIGFLIDHENYTQAFNGIEIYRKLKHYPLEFVQFIGLLMQHINEPEMAKYANDTISIISDLPKEMNNDIQMYVTIAFDRMINEFNAENNKRLQLFLKNFKFLIESRYKKLLQILNSLLDDYHTNNLPLIGTLFDVLSPPRNSSLSTYHSGSAINSIAFESNSIDVEDIMRGSNNNNDDDDINENQNENTNQNQNQNENQNENQPTENTNANENQPAQNTNVNADQPAAQTANTNTNQPAAQNTNTNQPPAQNTNTNQPPAQNVPLNPFNSIDEINNIQNDENENDDSDDDEENQNENEDDDDDDGGDGGLGFIGRILGRLRTRHQRRRNFDVYMNIKVPNSLRSQAPEFWSIVERHQRLMAQLIDEHNDLLSHEFRFLIQYPDLLPFQLRLQHFAMMQSRKIRGEQISLKINRNKIIEDSMRQLLHYKRDQIFCSLKIKFLGEPGIDAGGLLKDWFTSLVKELFNPNYALFSPSSNGRSNQPNPSSYVNKEDISFFRFAGRIIARSIIEGIAVPAHFTRGFLKHIIGIYHNTLTDLEDADEGLHDSFVWMLKNDVTPLEMTFSADNDDMGKHSTIDLKENGSNILVTNENKEEYVKLMIQHRLVSSISKQTQAFVDGFYSVIPLDEIQMFKPDELNLVICGIPEIDVDDFKKYCRYARPYNKDHKVIKMFFNVISKWKMDDLALLLMFITGSSQVPAGGFKSLADNQPITIEYGGDRKRLPCSHTCINTLDLPEYQDEKELEEKLMLSIKECNSFGFG